jgi:hypothetical protein
MHLQLVPALLDRGNELVITDAKRAGVNEENLLIDTTVNHEQEKSIVVLIRARFGSHAFCFKPSVVSGSVPRRKKYISNTVNLI